MDKNWKSPKISDAILLADGYEHISLSGRSHYGLVLCVFKLEGCPSQRYVMYAPGKTQRDGSPKDTDLIVPANTFGNSSPTIFQLSTDTVTLYEYPSIHFLESEKSKSTSQPGQATCSMGAIDKATIINDLRRIENNSYNGSIDNLYSQILSKYGINKITHPKDPCIMAPTLGS